MELPRLIALEVTQRCNLRCIHCRMDAEPARVEDELTTEEIARLFEDVAERVKPIVILTGGEPLMREDIFEIARRGTELGFHMTMAPNGTLMDEAVAKRMIDAGIRRISISLDGATAETHDAFRRMPGAFAGAMRGINAAKSACLPFQVNTSVTRMNVDEVPAIHELVKSLGAAAHHIFMLVRVGRGRDLDEEVPPARQERLLVWLHEQQRRGDIHVRATCAPHFHRIVEQRGGRPSGGHPGSRMNASTKGCLAGSGFVFISSAGIVRPCGYFDVDCGNIREEGFWSVWENSPIFATLRDDSKLAGKCGICAYVRVCGGCRARAFAVTGDMSSEDPACLYRPG